MAITIDATAGGASANSYATLAEANSYTESRLNVSTWDDATDDDKNRALAEGTRVLTYLLWCGKRATSTQALSWPRDWAINPDSPTHDYYDNTIVPQRVKDATCELAFQFIKAGTTDVAALDPETEVQSKTIDVLTTEYVQYGRPSGLARYPSVLRLLDGLLEGAGSTMRVQRG